MACNCGGVSPQTPVVYQLSLPDGTTRSYITYQEALAAKARAGGIGEITITTQ
ncbi:hypothetical protein [Streptomyces sp. SID1328]|uniref:DUF7196 family protein n=1 Tax=Streptomyces sp. SID1328 TaxID=2690250 RepID=UPI001925C552|nr:hypothetical protein [Streptomyces sp. SID1328]